MSLAMMYMFVYFIYIKYIDTFIKVSTQDLMETHHDFNHETISRPY
jgi:hypothetical protein